ncbi:MAG: hypothetical protein RLZZ258_702 [Actinomycetota bacterium]|jgi:cellulose synthase (UDP-forming)
MSNATYKNSSTWSRFGLWLAKYPGSMHAFAAVSVVLSGIYLAYRLVYTWQGANPLLYWLLVSAEFVGWLSLTLFVRDSWHRTTKLKHGQVSGKTVLLIPTYNEELDVLLPTIIGAKRVENCDEIWLLDDRRRAWVKQLAEEKGINYLARTDNTHAKAGNINNALKQVSSDFVLILDADHIPHPQIINKLLPYMIDPEIGVVQSPHGFRNLDSAQHYNRQVHEQSLFFDVLLPGRNSTNSVFWCGSGALLRTKALQTVGGVQTSTITEDLETSLAMQRAGYRTVYHDETLLQGLAPANLASYLIQRYRWARGTIEVLTSKKSPIFGRGMKLSARLSYLSNLVYYMVPLQHIAFVAVLVTTLLTAWLPISPGAYWLLILWLPHLALSLVVVLGMSAGKQLPFTGSKNAWLTVSIYVQAIIDRALNKKSSFQVTPKDGVEQGGLPNLRLLWLPALASASLFIAITARLISSLTGANFLPEMNLQQVLVTAFFASYELVIILPGVIRSVARQQHRHTWRFPVEASAEANGLPAKIVDLHLTGFQIEVSSEDAIDFKIGASFPISISFGESSTAAGNAVARRLIPSREPNRFNIGASVEWADIESRDLVIQAAFLNGAQRS